MAQVGFALSKDNESCKGNPSLKTIKNILEILGKEFEYRNKQILILNYETT